MGVLCDHEAILRSWLPLLLVAAPLHGAAATPPSEWQQRLACTGDAFRLCASAIPDRGKIRTCMAHAHDQLSEGCRRVFDASVAAGE